MILFDHICIPKTSRNSILFRSHLPVIYLFCIIIILRLFVHDAASRLGAWCCGSDCGQL
jgi:hypothetical protein